jgi:hypothetical protein
MSLRFPAGVAVVPHAIRILDRDAMSIVQVVRDSALRSLEVVEMILHPRLPPVKGVTRVVDNGTGDGEIEDVNMEDITHEDLEQETQETGESILGESVQEIVEEANEPEKLQVVEEEVTVTSTVSEDNSKQSFLPSFVQSPDDEPISHLQKETRSLTTPNFQITRSINSTTTSTTIEKKVQTNREKKESQEDDEESIPEIDMGFDSDEE